MSNYIFENRFDVRDYECDIQGILNNSVYQNYFEHTRHLFLKSSGQDFAKLHTQGIDPVLYRIEIDYKYSLKSGESCICKLKTEKQGNLKIIFFQDIFRIPDNKLIAKAKVIIVVLKNGKPIVPDNIIIFSSKLS